jgi:large subunit ribosomal protein L1
MTRLTKKAKLIQEKVTPGKLYPVDEALGLLQELCAAKFKESVDVSINLGVDPRKSDQVVRSSTVLPNGTGKTVRVAVFTQGANVDAAKEAGADIVGLEDLAEEPRGLMPNPKVGTVSQDVATAVKNAKAGQVRYRTDKAGIIHCPIGKADFEVSALRENLDALLADLQKAKPSSAKGIYLKKISVSTTMGPGLQVDQASLDI